MSKSSILLQTHKNSELSKGGIGYSRGRDGSSNVSRKHSVTINMQPCARCQPGRSGIFCCELCMNNTLTDSCNRYSECAK